MTRKASILMVDDRVSNLIALEAILSPLGHELVQATSGEAALRELARRDFALILLDVQMPGLDGLQTATIIKARPHTAGIPIIFVTATSQTPSHIFEAYSHGAIDYIVKPVDPTILRSKVSVLVDLHLKTEQIKEQERVLHEQQIQLIERRSEERQRRLMEVMPLPLWGTDGSGRLSSCNRAWIEFAGTFAPGESLCALPEIHRDDASRVRVSWSRSLREGNVFEQEFRLRRHVDATYRWHLVRGVPERGEDGAVAGWIVIATDIEEKKRAEDTGLLLLEREHEAREAAEAANRSKDEFLAKISHELRTPLNAILGWAQMLRKGGLADPVRARALETIERNAQAQARLISDLLDVSRIVTGKMRLDVRPVDIPEVVRTAIQSIEPAVAGQIRIETELEPGLGQVIADPTRLQQVVGNLLANSIKFGASKVIARVRRADDHVEIEIADDGKGIRADFLPHAFGRFRQADTTTSRTHGGLGLGLAIVHHIVQLHGGTVKAHSDGEGKGATFIVRLRMRSSGQFPVVQSGEHSLGAPDLSAVRVLVVDDDADARELLTVALERFGASVRAAASVDEAIGALAVFEPDVVVSDIGMPAEDGYVLIQRLNAMRQGRPVP